MSDERKGKPSASAVYRYAACPGSFRLCQDCREFRTKEMKAWAESGNRIHAVLAGQASTATLKPEEVEVFEQCRHQAQRLVATLIRADTHTYLENRLWLTKGRRKLISGKADQVSISVTSARGLPRGLVIDYKTNRGEQDDAGENHQLRTLIVLAAEQWPYVETWYAAIIQPLVTDNPKVVTYSRGDVAMAKAELLEILARVNKPDAPTNAGSHCKFCPAVVGCQSAVGMIESLGLVDPDDAEGQTLAGLLNLVKAVKPILRRIEERGKEQLKLNPAGIPGWQLGRPSSVRNITDPFACFQLLSGAGLLDRDTFLRECVSVGVGDVEKAVAKFKGLKPGEAKDAVNATCISVMEFKPKEPSLEQL